MDGPPQHKYVSIHGYGAFPGVSGRFASVQMADLEESGFQTSVFRAEGAFRKSGSDILGTS